MIIIIVAHPIVNHYYCSSPMIEIFISCSYSLLKKNPHLKSQVPGHHPALDGDEQVPHLPGQLAGGDRHCLRRTQVGCDCSTFFFFE